MLLLFKCSYYISLFVAQCTLVRFILLLVCDCNRPRIRNTYISRRNGSSDMYIHICEKSQGIYV